MSTGATTSVASARCRCTPRRTSACFAKLHDVGHFKLLWGASKSPKWRPPTDEAVKARRALLLPPLAAHEAVWPRLLTHHRLAVRIHLVRQNTEPTARRAQLSTHAARRQAPPSRGSPPQLLLKNNRRRFSATQSEQNSPNTEKPHIDPPGRANYAFSVNHPPAPPLPQ